MKNSPIENLNSQGCGNLIGKVKQDLVALTYYHKFNKSMFGLILLVLLLLLSACSTTTRITRDGPPNFKVDFSKIKDPVPKELPRSKYNNGTYTVRGRTYHVLRSAHGFDERGVASWYGTKFHRHRTSSGERYDMLGMTAAMRELPIPTYVQVTNLRNGKNVIVKVNDRGPFEHNRLIDLSYVAAAKLGVLGHGTALVEVRAISSTWGRENHWRPEHNKLHNKPHVMYRHHSELYLQIGAFSNKASAEHMRHHLRTVTHEPTRIYVTREGRHSIYRVQVGPLKDIKMSNKLIKHLESIGFRKPRTVVE